MQMVCEGHPKIADISQGMRLVLEHPVVRAEPVLEGESDVDAAGASLYGSVIRDGGVFRMWYQAWPRGWTGQDVNAVACVESDDGIHWRRPNYGLVDFGSDKNNHLTDMPFHSPSVVMIPGAPAGQRYRAFGYADPKRTDHSKYFQKMNRKGYFSAYSADGLHWELDSAEPFCPSADVITSAWDSHRRCVRIGLKKIRKIGGMIRRCFFTCEWTDGKISEPVSALIPDEYDDFNAHCHGFNSADYYGMGWIPAEGPTIGFLWNFRHMLPLGFNCGYIGRVDLSLVYQSELGGCWRHLPGRPDWLSADNAPTWAHGALYTASSTLDVGDETRLYFMGTLDGHGWLGAGTEYDKGIDYDQWIRGIADKKGFSRIGMMHWPKDRLMGYHANHSEWIHLESQFVETGESGLKLNVTTGTNGHVSVALLAGDDRKPVPGYSAEECEVITGNHLSAQVHWKNKTTLPPWNSDVPLIAKVEITQGTLYAFEFTQGR